MRLLIAICAMLTAGVAFGQTQPTFLDGAPLSVVEPGLYLGDNALYVSGESLFEIIRQA